MQADFNVLLFCAVTNIPHFNSLLFVEGDFNFLPWQIAITLNHHFGMHYFVQPPNEQNLRL